MDIELEITDEEEKKEHEDDWRMMVQRGEQDGLTNQTEEGEEVTNFTEEEREMEEGPEITEDGEVEDNMDETMEEKDSRLKSLRKSDEVVEGALSVPSLLRSFLDNTKQNAMQRQTEGIGARRLR